MLPVVVNPAAGRGRSAAATERALCALTALGAEPTLVPSSNVAEATAAVTCLRGQGCDRLVVIGGDGLVHHALGALAGSDMVLGIIPVGTGNDVASALGLPADPAAAAAAALGLPTILDAVDLGGGRWAASVATVGFAADVNAWAERLSWPRGAGRYTVATLACLKSMRPRAFQITLDGAPPMLLEAALVAVANTAMFGGGMRIAPHADPTDGQLDVVVIGAVGRLELLASFARVFRGSHLSHRAVTSYRATEVVLHSEDTADQLWADGEQIGPLPVTLSARRAVWRVASARVSR